MAYPKSSSLHIACLLALAILQVKAFAQAAPPSGDSKDSTNAKGTSQVLDPVVVRGGRDTPAYQPADNAVGVLGDLAPLSTPFSVNSLSHDLIVNQQASYLGDFLKNDPSAAVGNVVVSFATLRGFSLGSGGFLFDGLQLGPVVNDGRVALDAFDRVDVLKGASAFLYGLGSSSSLGGVINYVPKTAQGAPVHDVYTTYVSRSQLGLGVDLGDRFGADKAFGLRVNASFRDGDTAVDETKWRQGTLSLAGDWRVTPGLSVQAGYYHVDNDFERIVPFFVGASDAQGNAFPIPKAPDADKSFSPSWSVFNQRTSIAWLRGDWSFAPDWKLTLQFGSGENERPYGHDMDTRFGLITSAAGDIALFAGEESYRVRAQAGQALVHGKFATGPLQHEITLGASASEEKDYSSFETAGVIPGSLYQPDPTPQPALVPLEILPYTGKTKTSGLFLSDILHFDDRWSMLLGGRQAKIDTYAADGTKDEGGSLSKFSPAVALMFKPTPSSLLYANFAQGLEPGGTAPDGTANVGQIMPAQVTKQYEIGAKIELGGTTITGALFDMRRPLQSRDAAGNWVQQGEQIHKGFELLASGAVTPDLRVVAGAMFLDAKQSDTNDPSSDGKRVTGVPRWTANAWLDYRIAAVPGLYVNAGVYYSGSQYFDNANLQSIPSWTRFDLGARYEMQAAGHPLALLLAVENVANRSYWQSALGNALTLGDPLTVKATARVSF